MSVPITRARSRRSAPRTEQPPEQDLRSMNPHLRASCRTRGEDGSLGPDYAVDDVLRATGLLDAAACRAPERREPCDPTATGHSGPVLLPARA